MDIAVLIVAFTAYSAGFLLSSVGAVGAVIAAFLGYQRLPWWSVPIAAAIITAGNAALVNSLRAGLGLGAISPGDLFTQFLALTLLGFAVYFPLRRLRAAAAPG
jgi:hypothetical protein